MNEEYTGNWVEYSNRPRRSATREGEAIFEYLNRLFDEGKLIYDDGDVLVNFDFIRKDGVRTEGPKKIETLDRKGYYRHTFTINGKKQFIPVHRIVYAYHYKLKEFPKGLVINHINGIKTDNRIENLELVTYKENAIHAVKNGLRNPENCYLAKLTWEKVNEIRCLINNTNEPHWLIAQRYNISKSAVDGIAQNKSWRDESWQKTRGRKSR